MKKKKRVRGISIFFIIISMFSVNLVNAEELNNEKRILEFESIEQLLEVEKGTKVEDLELPETLYVKLENEEVFQKIDVTWSCSDYNSQKIGNYVFKAKLQDQYLYDKTLPDITVSVKEKETKGKQLSSNEKIVSLSAIDETVTIDLSDSNLVSGTGYTVSGTRITLTDDYDYVLTGSTARYLVEISTNTRQVTLKDLTITSTSASPIILRDGGNITIIVSGENLLKSTAFGSSATPVAGLFVQGDTDVVIKESTETINNVLTCQVTDGNFTCAMIGGKYYSGTFIIENGTIIADAQTGYRSGIGTSFNMNLDPSYDMSGKIIINGGNITAVGGSGAAIGSGIDAKMTGDIIINGGNISATTPAHGAGIGSGSSGVMSGNIEINGGTIIAKSNNGAGIGSGSGAELVGNVTIDCISVDATSGSGAAIGSGQVGDINENATVTITGNTVVTTHVTHIGSGIGVGYQATLKGTLTIAGNTDITTTAKEWGAGIGAGRSGNIDGTINITDNATVKAIGGTYGPGIGSSRKYGGDDSATSGFASGTINISGGSVYAIGGVYGGDGIGHGVGGSIRDLTVSIAPQAKVEAYAVEGYYGINATTKEGMGNIINGYFTDDTVGAIDIDIYSVSNKEEEVKAESDMNILLPEDYKAFAYTTKENAQFVRMTTTKAGEVETITNGNKKNRNNENGPYKVVYGYEVFQASDRSSEKWPVLLRNANLTITYDANGGTFGGVPVDSVKYVSGEEATILENSSNVAKIGHTFIGWSTNTDGSDNLYRAGNKLTFKDSDIILYAQYSANTYKITYDLDGGEIISDNLNEYTFGIEMSLPIPTKAGYDFVGWYNEKDELISNISLTTYGDLELHAVWKKKTVIADEKDRDKDKKDEINNKGKEKDNKQKPKDNKTIKQSDKKEVVTPANQKDQKLGKDVGTKTVETKDTTQAATYIVLVMLSLFAVVIVRKKVKS